MMLDNIGEHFSWSILETIFRLGIERKDNFAMHYSLEEGQTDDEVDECVTIPIHLFKSTKVKRKLSI